MNTQVNVTIPVDFKNKLEEIARNESAIRGYDVVYTDLIRESIVKTYDLNEVSEEEVARCRNDFFYFLENHVTIPHPTKGLGNLEAYPYQRKYIKHIENNRFSIGPKFRQGGFTTITLIYFLWKAMFQKDQRLMVICKTDREAQRCSEVISNVIMNLKTGLRPELVQNNAHTKAFINKNVIFCYTPEASRGKSLTHIFVDEAAFIDNMENFWKCLYPCIMNNGKAIIISTQNKIDTWFNKMLTEANAGRNNFAPFFFDYREHPVYQNPEWVKATREALGEKGWMQEVEQCVVAEKISPKDMTKSQLLRLLQQHRICVQCGCCPCECGDDDEDKV